MKRNGTIRIADPGRLILNNFQSPIVPVITRIGKAYNLRAWMLREGFSCWAVAYPVVPKGEERLRVMLHSDNSHPQIERFVDVLMQWALDQDQDKNLDFKAQL